MNKITIELGGKERTLRFNTLFVKELENIHSELNDNEDIKAVNGTACFIYAALKADSKLTGNALDLTYADCYDLAEELILTNQTDKLQRINDAYQESTAYTYLEEIKKKMEEMNAQIGTQLNAMHLAS